MRNLQSLISSLVVMVLMEASVFAQGCAMCRAALESSAEGRFVARSFAHGILLMLTLPYALFAVFGFILYRAYRKRKQRQRNPYSYQT
jgi:hypothetical protein